MFGRIFEEIHMGFNNLMVAHVDNLGIVLGSSKRTNVNHYVKVIDGSSVFFLLLYSM